MADRGRTVPSAVPLSLPEALAALLELSAERDKWLARLGAEYLIGWKLGYAAGSAAERLEADQAWSALPRRRLPYAPLADVEAKRWELRGEQRTRETFGQPHPADYKGRGHERAA
jgi:hypothetical protein